MAIGVGPPHFFSSIIIAVCFLLIVINSFNLRQCKILGEHVHRLPLPTSPPSRLMQLPHNLLPTALCQFWYAQPYNECTYIIMAMSVHVQAHPLYHVTTPDILIWHVWQWLLQSILWFIMNNYTVYMQARPLWQLHVLLFLSWRWSLQSSKPITKASQGELRLITSYYGGMKFFY